MLPSHEATHTRTHQCTHITALLLCRGFSPFATLLRNFKLISWLPPAPQNGEGRVKISPSPRAASTDARRSKCSLLPCETERIQFSISSGGHTSDDKGQGGKEEEEEEKGGGGHAREKLASSPLARLPPHIPRSPASQPRLTVRIAASCRFFRPHLVGGGSRQKQRGYIGNKFICHVAFPLTRALGAPLRTGRRGRDPVHQREALVIPSGAPESCLPNPRAEHQPRSRFALGFTT